MDFKNILTPKYILTYSIYFCYFSNAVNYGLVGATLTSLATIYNKSLEEIMIIVTIRTATYVIGALTGFGYKYVNRQISLIVSTITMGLTLGLLPTVKSFPVFCIIGAINGVAAGASDTANNAWILEMWDEKVGPYLLAMHFCFGTGMVIAPQIARPFLMGDASSVVMAYVICASIIIISGIVVTFVIFSGKYRTTETQPIEDTAPNAAQVPSITEELIRESERRELKPVYGVMIAILGCLMLATYTSMEMTYFSYESVFAQLSSYKMSEADATVLNTVTLAVYTITRGVDVLLLVKVSAYIILLYHFIIIITFNLVAIFTSNLPSSWLWIYNLGIGIGCGSVTPTIYTVLSQNFTIDDKKTAILLFVGGGMGALYPYIVTTNIMAYPLIFIYISVTTIAVCIVFLFAIKFIAWKFGRIIRPQMVVTAADLTAKELATELSSLDI